MVWQKSMDLAENIYSLLKNFPKEELYSLSTQMKRAVISVPSNIAEGSSKRSTKEYIRFLNISYGSLAELKTQIQLSFRLKFINEDEKNNIKAKIDEIAKMLNGLINALSKKLND